MSDSVLVIGPRGGHERDTVHRVLDRMHGRDGRLRWLVTADGRGVCEWAVEWASSNAVDYAVLHNRFEDGPDPFMRAIKRNSRMLNTKPTHVLVFEGRIGSEWLVANAARAGLAVKHYNRQ